MGRLRALNGAIACENITSEHIDPFEVIVVSHAAQEPVIYVSEAAPSASSFSAEADGPRYCTTLRDLRDSRTLRKYESREQRR